MKKTLLLLTGLALFEFKINAQTTMTDSRDGNVYNIVTIGTQVWMAENLKYLPTVVGPDSTSATTPLYYVYNYDGTSVTSAKAYPTYSVYGVLFNWPSACSSCPSGWHLPSDAEWTLLIDYLGGENIAGGRLKEMGTTHWASPNTEATDQVGFTALPGGFLFSTSFDAIGLNGRWWSATEDGSNNAWHRALNYASGSVLRSSPFKDYGYSVRCVRDTPAHIELNNENQNINIYPNPASVSVNINVKEMWNLKMQIYDLVGKCVITGDLKNGANLIEVSKLTKGIYVVNITGNIQTYQIKLIKE